MLELRKGDMFQSGCEALVNTVNCNGAMGAGLAAIFRKKWPQMNAEYVKICKDKMLRPGILHIWENPEGNPKYIVNFPTKDEVWKDSKMEYVKDGLNALTISIAKNNIKSISLPALGSGLGNLAWEDVKKEIMEWGAKMPDDVKIIVFEPLDVR